MIQRNTSQLRVLLFLFTLFFSACAGTGSENAFDFEGLWRIDYFAEEDSCGLGEGLLELHEISLNGEDPRVESESGLLVARQLELRVDGSLLATDFLPGGVRLPSGENCDLLAEASYEAGRDDNQTNTLFRFEILCGEELLCRSAYIGLGSRELL